MDKNRIDGTGKKMMGGMKEAAGKVTGNDKLKFEGKAEKAAGKVQDAAGKTADDLRKGDRRS